MSEDKKAYDQLLKEFGEERAEFNKVLIERDELKSKLKASEWIRKDNSLRTYDGLTEENKQLKTELDSCKKEYAEYVRGQSGTWYVTQLQKENEELRAEIERLRSEDYKPSAEEVKKYRSEHECGMYTAVDALKATEYSRLKSQLTLERKITAVLREALEVIARPIPESINTSEVEAEQTNAAQRALAQADKIRGGG